MATHNENLQKINAELEKLDDEQLEQVTGGSKHDYRIYNQAGIATTGDGDYLAKSFKTGEDVSIPENLADFAVEMWKKTGRQPSSEEIGNEWCKKILELSSGRKG